MNLWTNKVFCLALIILFVLACLIAWWPRTERLECPALPPMPPSSSSDQLLIRALHLVTHLDHHERSVYSQNGEDGVIEGLFAYIGTKNRYCVEFGTESCRECNTRYLREMKTGWSGLLMDGSNENPSINLHKELIRHDNIVDLFRKYQVPLHFDLLSVDTDFKDYWILKAILQAGYRPRVIVSEVNTFLGWDKAITVAKDAPDQFWDGRTKYFGFSLAAGYKLAREFNYSIVYCERIGVNCFFVIDGKEGFGEGFRVSDFLLPQHIYRPNLLPHKPDGQLRAFVRV